MHMCFCISIATTLLFITQPLSTLCFDHSILTLCLLGNFSRFWTSANFFQKRLFRKILSGIPSEFQMIWFKTVCKSCQQTTVVGKELRQKLHRSNLCSLRNYFPGFFGILFVSGEGPPLQFGILFVSRERPPSQFGNLTINTTFYHILCTLHFKRLHH